MDHIVLRPQYNRTVMVYVRAFNPESIYSIGIFLRTSQYLQEWYNIPLDTSQHLYDSIPMRVRAVLLANGDPTPY